MREKQAAKVHLTRTIVLIGVLASLLFSVGEGLRLRPFPVPTFDETEFTNPHENVTAWRETSLHKYGPLDVPTQAQKRSKRPAVDYGCPSSQSACELPAGLLRCSGAGETVGTAPLVSVSQPAGRAPPFIS